MHNGPHGRNALVEGDPIKLGPEGFKLPDDWTCR